MTDDLALSLVNAGKRYTKFEDQPLLVTQALRFRQRTRTENLWAVRNVNLDIRRGECVGIIGRNGAGKSTMLRLLAGVTTPSEGHVIVRGSVAPLVAVGVGFHPELTGRENVYINGQILGLTRKQVDERIGEILGFADVGHFVDTPVKFYSSGMYVRLGFAVAIHAEPDILLVDEVLAVGDVSFSIKCFERMETIASQGTTVIVVSHNLLGITRLCKRTCVMEGGELVFDGPTNDAVSKYHELLAENADIDEEFHRGHRIVDRGVAKVESFRLLGSSGRPRAAFHAGEEMTFAMRIRFSAKAKDPGCNLIINDEAGRLVYKEPAHALLKGEFAAGDVADVTMKLRADLATGSFQARSMILSSDITRFYDHSKPVLFHVVGRDWVGGLADLRAKFEATPVKADSPGKNGAGRTGAKKPAKRASPRRTAPRKP